MQQDNIARRFKLAHWNANSIVGKGNWSELKYFIRRHNVDIMAVSETKLSERINLSLPGYSILRKDRNRHGAVVLLACRNEIVHHQLDKERDYIEATGTTKNLRSGSKYHL